MKKISLLFSLLFIVMSLTSCGSAPEAAEMRGIAEALIEASYEVNDIFFGEGLPAIERDSQFAIDNHVYYMDEGGNYDYVAEESRYQTTAEIKAAALEAGDEDLSEDEEDVPAEDEEEDV